MTNGATSPASAGALLKEGRQRAGLSVTDLAKQIRIPARYIDAMEHDQWGELPSETHRTGFLKRLGETLELPSEKLLRLYHEGAGNRRARPRVAGAPPPEQTVSHWSGATVQQVFIALVLLVTVFWLTYHHFARYHYDYALIMSRFRPHHSRLEAPQQTVYVQRIRIDSKKDSWLRVMNHRQLVYEGVLPAGVTKEWSGAGPFRIKLSNIQAVSVFWNDQLVDTASTARGSISDVTIPPPLPAGRQGPPGAR